MEKRTGVQVLSTFVFAIKAGGNCAAYSRLIVHSSVDKRYMRIEICIELLPSVGIFGLIIISGITSVYLSVSMYLRLSSNHTSADLESMDTILIKINLSTETLFHSRLVYSTHSQYRNELFLYFTVHLENLSTLDKLYSVVSLDWSSK